MQNLKCLAYSMIVPYLQGQSQYICIYIHIRTYACMHTQQGLLLAQRSQTANSQNSTTGSSSSSKSPVQSLQAVVAFSRKNLMLTALYILRCLLLLNTLLYIVPVFGASAGAYSFLSRILFIRYYSLQLLELLNGLH
jgi:Transmembrane protein 33/Nucleoporin POM33